MATFFFVESISFSPHHVSFKCISSHFRGPGSPQLTHANAFEVGPPQLQTCCAIHSQTNKALPSLETCPSRLFQVRLRVGSHLPVNKPGYRPASHPQYYFAHHPLGCKQRSLFWNFRSHSNRVQFRTLETLFHPQTI